MTSTGVLPGAGSRQPLSSALASAQVTLSLAFLSSAERVPARLELTPRPTAAFLERKL